MVVSTTALQSLSLTHFGSDQELAGGAETPISHLGSPRALGTEAVHKISG